MKPTAKQYRLFAKVAEIGCMACRQNNKHTPAQIHHWREYGYRDHNKVFGLCPVHHTATASVDWITNRHIDPAEFAEEFGTDEDLFNECMALIGE